MKSKMRRRRRRGGGGAFVLGWSPINEWSIVDKESRTIVHWKDTGTRRTQEKVCSEHTLPYYSNQWYRQHALGHEGPGCAARIHHRNSKDTVHWIIERFAIVWEEADVQLHFYPDHLWYSAKSHFFIFHHHVRSLNRRPVAVDLTFL